MVTMPIASSSRASSTLRRVGVRQPAAGLVAGGVAGGAAGAVTFRGPSWSARGQGRGGCAGRRRRPGRGGGGSGTGRGGRGRAGGTGHGRGRRARAGRGAQRRARPAALHVAVPRVDQLVVLLLGVIDAAGRDALA